MTATQTFNNVALSALSYTGSGAGLTSIPNSATTATNLNTASAIVSRDTFGNFAAATVTLVSLSLRDNSGNFVMSQISGETLTNNRTLQWILGDTQRTITLSGNPTLGNWFDQSVKTTADVTHNSLTLTTPLAKAQGGTGVTAPAGFNSYKSASTTNQTGDGTNYVIICNTETVDIANNYDNSTGIFTAPTTGFYDFSGGVSISGLTSSHTQGFLQLLTTSQSYYALYCNLWVINIAGSGSVVLNGAWSGVYMTAGDTAKLVLAVYLGSKVVGVQGDGTSQHSTYFNGSFSHL